MAGFLDGVSNVWTIENRSGLKVQGYENKKAAALQLLREFAIHRGAFPGDIECLESFKSDVDKLIAEFQQGAADELIYTGEQE